MRYFFLLLGFCITTIFIFLDRVPTYNLNVERSGVLSLTDGKYKVKSEKPNNIWYVSIPKTIKNSEDICVEWKISHTSKTECIDHDGAQGDELFTFPILSSLTDSVEFTLKNAIITPSDITVYSLNTEPIDYNWTLRLPNTNADTRVVSRQQWGADETMRYTDSVHWQTKWPAYLEYVKSPKTQSQIDAINFENEQTDWLIKNGGRNTTIASLAHFENGHQLVFPILKVKQVSRIVLHHTAENMDSDASDEDLIRGIYAYHALSRQWGDIGYNYLIGQRGKIYEGRYGGDYVVASHASFNNMGTVGVAVLGDYNKNHLNQDQTTGIESAIVWLAQKYGITLSESKTGVRKCMSTSCSLFQTVTTKSLLVHGDIGYTDCPGSDISARIPEWISRLDATYIPVLNPISGPIDPKPKNRELNMEIKPEVVIAPQVSIDLPLIVPVRYIGPKFRVKLSYPDTKDIVIATADGLAGKLFLDKKKIILPVSQKVKISILPNNHLAVIVGSKSYSGSEIKLSHSVVRIDSWNRIPDWDKSGKYNDNLFRDTVRIITQNGKLLVINDLPVEWYLKGLGEVSNGDLSEKIKTIIVSARSYARYYMDRKNRKFATNLYDGSDNPDEFQKYLGYGYEMRSPNVAKLVDLTRAQVIVYQNSIIKTWYHSSSNGKTLSYLEYCIQAGGTSCKDIPYLQSVADPGSVGKTRSGHGVGISGIGATYWANAGWEYKKIIQYYLPGVEIQKK